MRVYVRFAKVDVEGSNPFSRSEKQGVCGPNHSQPRVRPNPFPNPPGV